MAPFKAQAVSEMNKTKHLMGHKVTLLFSKYKYLKVRKLLLIYQKKILKIYATL